MNFRDIIYDDMVLKPPVKFIELPLVYSFTTSTTEVTHTVSSAYYNILDEIDAILRADAVALIEDEDFNGVWSSTEYPNVYLPPDWLNSGMVVIDTCNQDTSDLPEEFTSGAYLKIDTTSNVGLYHSFNKVIDNKSLFGDFWIKTFSYPIGDTSGKAQLFVNGWGSNATKYRSYSYPYDSWRQVQYAFGLPLDATTGNILFSKLLGVETEYEITDFNLYAHAGLDVYGLGTDGTIVSGTLVGIQNDGNGIRGVTTVAWSSVGTSIGKLYIKIPLSISSGMWSFKEVAADNTVDDHVTGYKAIACNMGSYTYNPSFTKDTVVTDASNDYFYVPLRNINYFDFSKFSLEAIISYGSTLPTNPQLIVGKKTNDGVLNYSWRLYVAKFLEGATNRLGLYIEILIEDPENSDILYAHSINKLIGKLSYSGTNHYVAVTYDGRYLKGYIEGELKLTVDMKVELPAYSGYSQFDIWYETRGASYDNDLYFYAPGGSNSFNGKIGEVRIVDYVRVDEEIANLPVQIYGRYDGGWLDLTRQAMVAPQKMFWAEKSHKVTYYDYDEPHDIINTQNNPCLGKYDNVSDNIYYLWDKAYFTAVSAAKDRIRLGASLYTNGYLTNKINDRLQRGKFFHISAMNLMHGSSTVFSDVDDHGFYQYFYRDWSWDVQLIFKGTCWDGGDYQYLFCTMDTTPPADNKGEMVRLYAKKVATSEYINLYLDYYNSSSARTTITLVSSNEIKTNELYRIQLTYGSFTNSSTKYLRLYIDNKLVFDQSCSDFPIASFIGPNMIGNNYIAGYIGALSHAAYSRTFNGVIYYESFNNFRKTYRDGEEFYHINDYINRVACSELINSNHPASVIPELGFLDFDVYSYNMFVPLAYGQLTAIYPSFYSTFMRSDQTSTSVKYNNTKPSYLTSETPLGFGMRWQPTRYSEISDGWYYYDVESGVDYDNNDNLLLSRPVNDLAGNEYGTIDDYEKFGFGIIRYNKYAIGDESYLHPNTKIAIEMVINIATIGDNDWSEILGKLVTVEGNDIFNQWRLVGFYGMTCLQVSPNGTDMYPFISDQDAFEGDLWHHIIVTYQSNSTGHDFRLYIDGQPIFEEQDAHSEAIAHADDWYWGANTEFSSSEEIKIGFLANPALCHLAFGGYNYNNGELYTRNRMFMGDIAYVNILNKYIDSIEAKRRYMQFKDKIDAFNNIEERIAHVDNIGVGL